ncbi:MAG: endonuclease/exonuclease/phosphatase family protein [Myxococcota bacterium]
MGVKSTLRWSCWSAAAVVGAVSAFIWWAKGPSLPRLSRNLPIHTLFPPQAASPGSFQGDLAVMTYNMAHANGIKDKPWDLRRVSYAKQKLQQLAHVLRAAQADVVLLQEVDLHSARTGYVDQARFLAEQARYPYYACSIFWEKNYLPYPVWKTPAHHLGRIRAANCILSRYPIKQHSRLVFEKPRSNPFWYNLGYIDRGAQTAVLQVGCHRIAVVNAHLEAFDQSARHEQAEQLASWVQSLQIPWVLGGDLNAPPPEAVRKKGFADPDVDYRTDRTIEFVRAQLPPHVEATLDPPHILTFPSDTPERQLDHLFVEKQFQVLQARVFTEAETASDHLPVLAQLSLPATSKRCGL